MRTKTDSPYEAAPDGPSADAQALPPLGGPLSAPEVSQVLDHSTQVAASTGVLAADVLAADALAAGALAADAHQTERPPQVPAESANNRNPSPNQAISSAEAALEHDRLRNRPRRFRFTWFKHWCVYGFYWGTRLTPSWMVTFAFSSLIFASRLAYFIPGNPVKKSCALLAELMKRNGVQKSTREIYREMLDQFAIVGPLFHRIYLHGPEHALAITDLEPQDRAMVDDLRAKHGGVLVAVPHCIGAAISGIAMSHSFPSLLIGKNGEAEWRAEIAIEVFKRMGIDPLFVRGKNPFAVFRAMLEALKSEKVVVCTLDNLYRKENKVDAEMFGGLLGFNPWAARLATRAKCPIIPGYVSIRDGRVKMLFGPPLITNCQAEGVQHYLSFFEKCILQEPSSWAFLAHKRWRKVLEQAVARPVSAPVTAFELRSKELIRREKNLPAR